jgi:hypothetical protein
LWFAGDATPVAVSSVVAFIARLHLLISGKTHYSSILPARDASGLRLVIYGPELTSSLTMNWCDRTPNNTTSFCPTGATANAEQTVTHYLSAILTQ